MTPLVESLTAQARFSSAGEHANATIEEARQGFATAGGPALSYEIALPALDPDRSLLERALPRLVYFLDCRGMKLPQAPGVFISLFTPAGVFCIDATAVVTALAAARGLSMAELTARYGDGGTGDPPLLAP